MCDSQEWIMYMYVIQVKLKTLTFKMKNTSGIVGKD